MKLGTRINTESNSDNIGTNFSKLNNQGAVQVACHTCTMPGRILIYSIHHQHSVPFAVPYTAQQSDSVTISFYINNDFDQRRIFEIWQTAIINITDNSINFYDEYKANINIYQLDRKGNRTYGVTLFRSLG